MTSLTSQTLSLEDVFLQLTESEPDAAAPAAPAVETAPAGSAAPAEAAETDDAPEAPADRKEGD